MSQKTMKEHSVKPAPPTAMPIGVGPVPGPTPQPPPSAAPRSKGVCAIVCDVDGHHFATLIRLSLSRNWYNRPVGRADIAHLDSDTPVLQDLYVHPGFRRSGVGTEIVKAAIRYVRPKPLYLFVRPDHWARAWYQRMGFVETGNETEEGSLWMVRRRAESRPCSAEREPDNAP